MDNFLATQDKEEIESFIKKLIHSTKYDLTIINTKLRKSVKGELLSAILKIKQMLNDE